MKKLLLIGMIILVLGLIVKTNGWAQNLLPHKVGNYYGYSRVSDHSLIIEAKFDDAYNFSEGLAPVAIDGKFGFINKKGNTVIPFKYDDAFQFEHGGAVVVVDGKYGIINKSGKYILEPVFDKLNQYDGKGTWGIYGGTTGYVQKLSKRKAIVRCKDEEIYIQF